MTLTRHFGRCRAHRVCPLEHVFCSDAQSSRFPIRTAHTKRGRHTCFPVYRRTRDLRHQSYAPETAGVTVAFYNRTGPVGEVCICSRSEEKPSTAHWLSSGGVFCLRDWSLLWSDRTQKEVRPALDLKTSKWADCSRGKGKKGFSPEASSIIQGLAQGLFGSSSIVIL